MADNSLLLSRAKAAALSRDFAMATRLYKQLLAAKPDDSEILGALGNLYIKSGDDDKALPLFRKLIQVEPGNVENLITLGGIYRRLKQYGNSVAVLEQALALGSNNPQVSYNLGFTFKVMGNYDDAIACFEEVVDANPSDVLAYNHIGSIYAAQKNHQQAIETYRRALKVDPNHPVLQLNMARSYEALEEYDKAVRAYELALRSKPGWLEAIDSYTNLLIKQEKVREAYEIVRSALNLNPKDVKMHTKMGDVYARQSVYSSAAKEYQSALDSDDTYEPALLGLSDSQEQLGYSLDAAKNIEKVAANHPDDDEIQKRATGVLLSAGDFAGAFKKIDRLWEENPRDLETINLLAQYYICMNKIAKAEKCFSRIKSLNSAFTHHLRDAAKRFRQKGDLLNAEKYYRAAIEKNPRDAKAMMSLARLLEEQSQGDAALELYKRSSRLDRFNVACKNGVKRLQEGFDEDGMDFGDGDDGIGLENAGVVRSAADLTEETGEVDLNADFEDSGAGDEIALDDFDDSDFAPASEMDDADDLFEKELVVAEEESAPAMEDAAKEDFEDPMAFTDSDDPLLSEKDDLIDLLDEDGEETGLEDKTVIGERAEMPENAGSGTGRSGAGRDGTGIDETGGEAGADGFGGTGGEYDLAGADSDAAGGAGGAAPGDDGPGSGLSGEDAISFDDLPQDDEIDISPEMDEEIETDYDFSAKQFERPHRVRPVEESGVKTVIVDTSAISKGLEEIQEQLKSASEAAERANYAAQKAWDSANEAADAAQAAEEARRQSMEVQSEEIEEPEEEGAPTIEESIVEDEDLLDDGSDVESGADADEPFGAPIDAPVSEDGAPAVQTSLCTSSSQIELLKKLRSLAEFLPESKQNEFGASENREKLDRLIMRLSELED